MSTSPCISDDELAAWTEGSVSGDRISQLNAHVATCETCRVVLSEVTRTSGERASVATLGRYELQEKVGVGGMGTVYAAWDPKLGRKVAIKILHEVQRDAAHRAQRFLLERQILAGLEHPHIGHLLDAGETPEGRPYFVMEFVDGQPLDAYCDAHRLAPRARLELLLPVFAAVSHAHQHLVVHRDLKPGNILVTKDGQPKLVDFGIARLLEADAGLTATGMVPMTPAYASPEQVRREGVATTSDVYSLGVVVHELLTGVGPYAVASNDVEALLRAVTTQEATLPSAAVARTSDEAVARRAPSRERLRSELAGDVDAIVAMALRKEPKDRYASVQALADDVRAVLEGLPTAARKGNASYRALKFVRRHKTSVAALVAAFVALVAGLVTTIWQAQHAAQQRDLAQQRFLQVRALAHSVLFDYHDGIAALPGSTPLRERLVKDALGYLDSLAAEARDDVPLQRELAQGYLKVGDVQGDPFDASLGDVTAAKASYLKAYAIAASLPADLDARKVVSRSHEKLGAILEVSGDLRGALAEYETARDLDAKLCAEAPGDLDQQALLGRDELSIGQVLVPLGQLDRAAEALARALELRQAVARARPEMGTRRGLGAVLVSLASLRRDQGDVPGALVYARQAEALLTDLVRDYPDAPAARRALQTASQATTTLLLGVDPAGAIESSHKVLALTRQELAADPENAVAQRDLVIALSGLADALVDTDQPREAAKVSQEALDLEKQLQANDPANLQNLRDTGHLLETAGNAEGDAGNFAAARAHFEALLEVGRTMVAQDPNNNSGQEGLYSGWYGLGNVALKQARPAEAAEDYQRALEALTPLLATGGGRLRNRQALLFASRSTALVDLAQGRRGELELWRQARASAQQALDLVDTLEREQAILHSVNAARPELVALVARCDAALSKGR
jgi:non-specific serine/threonine protein kinase/serine/threonine-protein kinase